MLSISYDNLVTVCSEKRIDELKLAAYIEANPKLFPNETAKASARTFIKKLATISFESMGDFPIETDYGLHPDDYLELMSALKWDFVPEISSGTSNKLVMMRTITENGICDAVNSKTAYYNSVEYWKKNRWDLVKPNITGEFVVALRRFQRLDAIVRHQVMTQSFISWAAAIKI